ncbi:MAG: glycosyltransferase family 39 protein [Gemmatimonadota bacterium]
MIPLAESRQPAATSSGERRRALRWAVGTWGAGALYYATFFDRRWIPHDEGTLGQAAWRVMQGQVPHRDFDGMYTGMLDYVHAAAMDVLGVHLLTPRLLMLLAVMLWLPAVWSIAYRLVASPVGAAAVTGVALVMGPPNYPSAMPSWYNLFFATWGLWALIRWTDERRVGWLVVAGSAAGLSILFKVTGLYLLAGALFFALHDEARRGPTGSPASSPSFMRPFPVAAGVLVLALVVMQTVLVRQQLGPSTWISYVLPTAILGVALVWRAGHVEDDRAALRGMVSSWSWIAVGTLVMVLPFLAWYAVAGGLDDLYRGVFLLPAERFTDVALPVPSFARTWTIVVPVALLAVGAVVGRTYRIAIAAAVLIGMTALVLRLDARIFIGIFDSLLLIVPVVVAVGVVLSFLEGRDPAPNGGPLMATLWVLALVHLIRYPFAVPMYFPYVAPLAVVAVGGVLARAGARDVRPFHRLVPARTVLAAVALAYAGFFIVGPNRGGLFGPLPPLPEARLPLERGRISVPAAEADEYGRLVAAVLELTRSSYVYAGPDAPEVTFLAGLHNPTRSLFEIFEEDEARTERTMDALESHDVNVVVLNTRARFSSMPADLVTALVARYPNEMRVGRFLIRWSGEAGQGP